MNSKKKIINIGIDIETLSTFPTAAIVAIAAKAFDVDQDYFEYNEQFRANVNVMSAIVNGFHVEQETCNWWAERTDEVKEITLDKKRPLLHIKEALGSFVDWIEVLKEKHECDDVVIWMEGTDFDGAILRNALRCTFPEKGRKAVPWNYRQLRDARTFILEGIRLFHGNVENPFELIPKPETPFLHHDPMGDVEQMIWNIRYVNKLFTNSIQK